MARTAEMAHHGTAGFTAKLKAGQEARDRQGEFTKGPAAAMKPRSAASAKAHATASATAKAKLAADRLKRQHLAAVKATPKPAPKARAPRPKTAAVAPPPARAGEMTDPRMWDTTTFGTAPMTDADKHSAMSVYFGSGYQYTNAHLRNGHKAGMTPASVKGVDRLAALIGTAEPTSHPVQLHRGVHGANAIFGRVGSLKGKTIRDDGFTSLTSKGDVAKMYEGSDAAHISVHVPPGVRMLKAQDMVTGTSPMSSGERAARNALHEYLLAPGSSFQVDDDRVDAAGNRQISITVVPS